jgi:hypothetical protein
MSNCGSRRAQQHIRSPRRPDASQILALTELGDGRTEMLFEQRGRMTPEQYDRASEGWSTFFDQIEKPLPGG